MRNSDIHIFTSIVLLFFVSILTFAQTPTSYYKNADGAKGASLKTALCNIIYSHTNVGYDGLLTLYKTSDKRADGYLWDMYSDNTSYVIGGSKQNANYKKEGDSYNREHSVPQSWFNEASPMKSDAFHVVPTDGYVNNRRSNYPYGEVGTATYSSHNAFSKLGDCTTYGYNGTVFEPNDEYKGDFARIYFYMVTCYENQCTSWYSTSNGLFTTSKYPGLATWLLNMLLRWAKDDPVSQKEIDRNNAVYDAQKNRNPFVDFPGLEQYIWGDNVNIAFSYNDYVVPTGYGELNGGESGGGSDSGNTGDDTSHTDGVYYLVTDATTLSEGDNIIIVCPTDNVAISTTQNNNNRGQIGVTITNDQISSIPTGVQVFTIESSDNDWYFNTGSGYIYAGSSSKNYLLTETTLDENAKATITCTSANSYITFQGTNTRNKLQHNSSADIFSCYSSGQHDIQIFKKYTSSGIDLPQSNIQTEQDSNIFYNLSGQRVDRNYKGVVIHNGHKYIQR